MVLLSLSQGMPLQTLWFYLPVMLLSVALVALMLRGCWRNRAMLERLCAGSLILNLGTTAAYILAFLS
jgi:hypothetical protein